MGRERKINIIGYKNISQRVSAGNASTTIVSVAVTMVLILCILFPLICVFTTPRFEDFKSVFGSGSWISSALNTLLITIFSSAGSVIAGYFFAYAVVKSDMPFKKFFSVIPLFHLMTPPFVGGLSFILLLGRNGFITNKLLGLDVSLYGFWGILISQILCFFPIAYMICLSTLQNINGSLELGAKSLGASSFKIFRTVTLPLSFPGILSSFLFIAVSVMSDFGNPMIVGGRFKVLAVELYTQLTGWVNGGKSAVYGIILLIPSVILFVVQNIYSKKMGIKTAVVGSKGMKSSGIKCSPVSTVFLTMFCIFISLCVISQIVAIVAGSFQKLWGIHTEFTLDHVSKLVRYKTEIFNSLLFSIAGAFFAVLVSCIASYLVYRCNVRFSKISDILCQVPSAVPGSLFGLAFSLSAAKLNFNNSQFLIILAIAVGFMPFSYRIISSSFMQIKKTLDEAGRSLGSGKFGVLKNILLPLMDSAVFNAFVYCFVRGVGTMSAVIFLVSFKTPLASVKILNLSEQGFWGDACALSLLLTVITFVFIGFAKIIELGIKNKHKIIKKIELLQKGV